MIRQMKNRILHIVLTVFIGSSYLLAQTSQGDYFKQGKFGMFIHWGIYSEIANRWKDSTYYGAAEWIMARQMANIPAKEYIKEAANFNPVAFDAQKIVSLAKDAGMKYIVITSKHHDGFAMYNSKANDFNIVKATPYGKDPMLALAKACKDAGIGFGFYYSHNRDWTFPGAVEGPTTDENGTPQTFEDYFRKKCVPQVEEITTEYGPIEVIWFDTPGAIEKKYVEELAGIVKKNQPQSLISGRIGHGLGDYETLGDMEMPVENREGLWESIDVTNDSWGYAWYDRNWKSPHQIIEKLTTAVARGGTYLLNVGPDGQGLVPNAVSASFKTVGNWLKAYPFTVYGAEPSSWRHKLPWGDVTQKGNKLFLLIPDFPANGKLFVPGLKSQITKAEFLLRDNAQLIDFTKNEYGYYLDLRNCPPDPIMSVVQLTLAEKAEVDNALSIDPYTPSSFSVLFAETKNNKVTKDHWMEKFGEHKYCWNIGGWTKDSQAEWTINVPEAGYYLVRLNYKADNRVEWRLENGAGNILQNKISASSTYTKKDLGWMHFPKPTSTTLKLNILNTDDTNVKLESIEFEKIYLEE